MRNGIQKNKILNYCEKHGSITVREAFNLDINSPTKVISVLRKSGLYDVRTEEECRTNKDGEKKTYTRYYISRVGV